jgi:hypothetical protein
MRDLLKVQDNDPMLAKKIVNQNGFLTMDDVKDIIAFDRLMLLLVRCGNGRFLTPAQNVEWFCNIIEK